jgi:predicted GNAT family acetyltransferase
MTTAVTTTITDVPARRRFEIRVDGDIAGFVEYRRRPGVISLVHTEIDPSRAGTGLGTSLVRAVLDRARKEGLAVQPYCPFIRRFIDRHPEYLDLVPMERRTQFGLSTARKA